MSIDNKLRREASSARRTRNRKQVREELYRRRALRALARRPIPEEG